MRIVWIGGGSIGLLHAGRFALAGLPAALVVRSGEQRDRILEDGLSLLLAEGERTAFLPCEQIDDDAWFDEPPDWMALAVKQTHLSPRLIGRLAEAMRSHPAAKLLCFQNGIGHVDKLSEHLPADRIFVAVTTEGARRVGWNRVEHTGSGTLQIGHWTDPRGRLEEAKIAVDAFRQAGFHTCVSNNIKEAVWKKLLINAAVNPLTAVLRVPNGALLSSAPWLEVMRRLFEESRQIARAEGIAVPDSAWDELIEVCRRTANNRSSMLQDVESGRETEIEAINGSLVRLARKHGISAPLNETVADLIRGMQRP